MERNKILLIILALAAVPVLLFASAFVAGGLSAIVQGQCTASASGLSAADVRIADYGVTSGGDLVLELRNAVPNAVTVTDISVGSISTKPNKEIEVGSTTTVTITEGTVSNTDGCNDFNVSINYTEGVGTTTQSITGTLTDSKQITP